jgi:microcystin-dependent protein
MGPEIASGRRRALLRVFLFLMAAAVAAPTSAWAGGEPYLGEIDTFTYNFCPNGWAPLNGQLMPISQNTALFSLLGTTYGGNGQSTFALPTGKPVLTLTQGAPLIQCIALLGIYPSRN